MSLITLEFEFGNDIDVLTNDVRDKLDMVSSQLPDDVENPIIFKFSTDMIPIVLLSVQANEAKPRFTRYWTTVWLTRWHVFPVWERCLSVVRRSVRFRYIATLTNWKAYNLSIETIRLYYRSRKQEYSGR